MKSSGDFNRSFIALASGTLVAQAIPIAISPLLTRLFSPEQLGGFALFMAIVTVLGGIAAARYEMAIMLPESQRDAYVLAWLSGGISTVFCLLLFIPCVIWNDAIASLVGDQTLSWILPWMPLAVWFLVVGAIMTALASRERRFSVVARANVVKSASMSGVQVGAGFANLGVSGLIVGNLLGGMVFLANLYKVGEGGDRPQFKDLGQQAYRYRDFPKYSLWATLANGISVNVLSFLLSIFYSLVSLGFYNLVQRVLAAPSAVIGGAIGQVFYQRASVELRDQGSILRSFHSAWFRLLFISVPPFLLIFLFAESIFAFVFGEQWRVAGHYAEILAPMFWVRFWVSPLSSTNQLLLQNKFGLLANLALLFISVLVVIYAAVRGLGVEEMLTLMNAVMVLFYLCFFVFLYHSAALSNSFIKNSQSDME